MDFQIHIMDIHNYTVVSYYCLLKLVRLKPFTPNTIGTINNAHYL